MGLTKKGSDEQRQMLKSQKTSLLSSTDNRDEHLKGKGGLLAHTIKILTNAKGAHDPDALAPVVEQGNKIYGMCMNSIDPWEEWKRVRDGASAGDEVTANIVKGKTADLPIAIERGSFEVTAKGSCSKSAKLEAVRQLAIARDTLSSETEGSIAFKAALEAKAQAELEVGEWVKIDASVRAFVGAVLEAKGTGKVSWEGVLLEASVSFFAGLKVSADAKVQLGNPENNVTVKGSLEGTAGVEASASAKFGLNADGFEAVAEFSAFAGCKAAASVESTLTLFSREIITKRIVAEASIGVGVSGKAEIKVGVENVSAGLAFNCTLGVGIGAETSLSINPVNVALTIREIKNRIKDYRPYLNGFEQLEMQSGLTELHLRRERIIKFAEKELAAVNKKYVKLYPGRSVETDSAENTVEQLQSML